jgi:hypothetical protein
MNLNQCKLNCDANKKCRIFAFDSNTKRCALKSTIYQVPSTKNADGYFIGIQCEDDLVCKSGNDLSVETSNTDTGYIFWFI